MITPCGGASGIAFVTYPQSGLWLYVETTSSGGPDGSGIDFLSTNDIYIHTRTGSTHGIFLGTNQGTGVIDLNAGGDIDLNAGGIIDLATNDAGLLLSSASSLSADTGGMLIRNQDYGADIVLRTNRDVVIQDVNGTPIFRVNQDGSLQGLTGKSLTFNL